MAKATAGSVKPIAVEGTFDAPKSRQKGPKLTKAQRSEIAKVAGKKAAASRRATLYTVKVKDAAGNVTDQTVNGSQLAGMRAAVARRAAKVAKKG